METTQERYGRRRIWRYLHPPMMLTYVLLGVTLLLLGICFMDVVGFIRLRNLEGYFTLPMMTGIITLITSIERMRCFGKFNKQMKLIKASTGLSQIIQEFEQATPYIGDRIRLGQHFIFGRRSGLLVRYTEIMTIYEYKHSTNGITDDRRIRIQFSDKKKCDICRLKVLRSNEEEEDRVYKEILKRNPNIQIGYIK